MGGGLRSFFFIETETRAHRGPMSATRSKRKGKGLTPLGGERAAETVEAGFGRFLEGVLPDADDFPSPAPELAGDTAIARHVFLAFAVPKGAVGFRSGVALGADVPIASAVRRQNVRAR